MKQDSTAGNVKRGAEQAVKKTLANPWVERLARFGYAAKGAVYCVIGVLAVMAAFGAGGGLTDSRGAMQTILAQSFGKVLLGIVAVGLIGYALWRFVQAGIDAENKGTSAKGIAVRIGYAISGLIHCGLALTAAKLVFGAGGEGGGNGSQDWTAQVLAQDYGRWLVGAVGAIIVGVGVSQFYKAYSAKFRDKLNGGEMSAAEQRWATRSGKLGFAARGLVFVLIGFFIVQAAWTYDASKVQGVGGALAALAGGPFGWLVLFIVATGLVAYGVFMFVQARYRRISTE
ncbi:MAG: DUF1206 domain-containing protein [Pyrinomonadaceae bacterium]|nr:DUF1206 domain-containing protein [Pyrinomonadaceae bacterium]